MKYTDIKFANSDLLTGESETKERDRLPLSLDIQFFAEKPEDSQDEDDQENPDDEEDDEDDEDDVDLEELIKTNPKAKAKHEELLTKQLGRRTKAKQKEIDRLQGELDALKGKSKKPDADEEKDDATKEAEQKLQKIERREKKAAIKLFAAESSVDAVLFERFVDFSEIELDEDGNAENLEDILEDLQEKYPKYFAASDDSDDEETSEKKKSKGYNPGKQKMNKKNKPDPAELGRQKALERHGKKQ